MAPRLHAAAAPSAAPPARACWSGRGAGRARRRGARAVRRRAGAATCVVPAGSPFHLSDYWVTLVGKIMCYAIVALAMDLIWGYTGILSLGHGLFFALGGYAMGMYLMRSDRPRRRLPERPARLHGVPRLEGLSRGTGASPTTSGTRRCWSCWCPALLAFVFGFFAFRSRIKGVYFSIITQALTFASCCCSSATTPASAATTASPTSSASSAIPITAPETRMALFALTGVALLGTLLLGALDRDLEARPRADRDPRRREPRDVLRLQPAALQALRLDAVGGDVRHRRRALRAAGRHHQPERDVAGQLDRDRDLGRGRRPRHADRPGRSAPAWSTARRAGSRRRFPSTGCTSSACCSSWSRCSCRTAWSGSCGDGDGARA